MDERRKRINKIIRGEAWQKCFENKTSDISISTRNYKQQTIRKVVAFSKQLACVEKLNTCLQRLCRFQIYHEGDCQPDIILTMISYKVAN